MIPVDATAAEQQRQTRAPRIPSRNPTILGRPLPTLAALRESDPESRPTKTLFERGLSQVPPSCLPQRKP